MSSRPTPNASEEEWKDPLSLELRDSSARMHSFGMTQGVLLLSFKMKEIFKKINRLLVKCALAFKPFGFVYFYANYFVDRLITWVYCAKPFSSVKSLNCNICPIADQEILDLVTVAFNNADVIEWQIKFLRKNLRDNFVFTVVDNSQGDLVAQAVEGVCKNYSVGYIRLSKNPYSGTFPSWSHGLALNWVYKNFLLPRKAKYFGFLDHDIFPVKSTSVLENLQKSPIYGSIQRRGSVWWMWPGFCFFRSEVFKNVPVNFSTAAVFSGLTPIAVDTGGGNWKKVYSKTKPEDLHRAVHEYAFLREAGDPGPDGKPYNWVGDNATLKSKYDTSRLGENDRFIEFIDGWLHIRKMGYSKDADAKLKLKALLTFFA